MSERSSVGARAVQTQPMQPSREDWSDPSLRTSSLAINQAVSCRRRKGGARAAYARSLVDDNHAVRGAYGLPG